MKVGTIGVDLLERLDGVLVAALAVVGLAGLQKFAGQFQQRRLAVRLAQKRVALGGLGKTRSTLEDDGLPRGCGGVRGGQAGLSAGETGRPGSQAQTRR